MIIASVSRDLVTPPVGLLLLEIGLVGLQLLEKVVVTHEFLVVIIELQGIEQGYHEGVRPSLADRKDLGDDKGETYQWKVCVMVKVVLDVITVNKGYIYHYTYNPTNSLKYS